MAQNRMPQKSSSCCTTCTMIYESTYEAALEDYFDSICPYCHQARGEAHGFVKGQEVACPAFAFFPRQILGR